jgi:hypothetical protein
LVTSSLGPNIPHHFPNSYTTYETSVWQKEENRGSSLHLYMVGSPFFQGEKGVQVYQQAKKNKLYFITFYIIPISFRN